MRAAAKRKKNVMKKRGKEKRAAVRIIPVAAAATIGLLIYVFLGTDCFRLLEVRYFGCRDVPIDSLLTVTDGFIGRNIVTLPLSTIQAGFMRFPGIKRVTFKRRLFHRLDCYIKGREPVAILASVRGMHEIDDEGVILSGGGCSEVDLPVITGVAMKEYGTGKEKDRIDRALTVLGLLKAFDFSPAEQLSEIHLDGDEVMLVLLGTGAIVRLGSGEFPERIRKLRAVYGTLVEDGSFPQLIDLRFDRQVVVR